MHARWAPQWPSIAFMLRVWRKSDYMYLYIYTLIYYLFTYAERHVQSIIIWSELNGRDMHNKEVPPLKLKFLGCAKLVPNDERHTSFKAHTFTHTRICVQAYIMFRIFNGSFPMDLVGICIGILSLGI